MTRKPTESRRFPSKPEQRLRRRTISWWIQDAGLAVLGLLLMVLTSLLGPISPDDRIDP